MIPARAKPAARDRDDSPRLKPGVKIAADHQPAERAQETYTSQPLLALSITNRQN
jgi:hypothetical protein